LHRGIFTLFSRLPGSLYVDTLTVPDLEAPGNNKVGK